MNRRSSGMTMVEVLTVVGIIALLIGILVPALTVARKFALEVKQKGQIGTLGVGLETFKNDYGDYPPSNWTPQPNTGDYCGAQKLAEALLGRDLLGFHPNSNWDATDPTWYPLPVAPGNPAYPAYEMNLRQRKAHYVELATSEAYRLGNISPLKPGLYPDTRTLGPDTFVLCDVFARTTVVRPGGKVAKAGQPVLYYKANVAEKDIRLIYSMADNDAIVDLAELVMNRPHPLGSGLPNAVPALNQLDFFYGPIDPTVVDGLGQPILGYIQDPKVAVPRVPYRPDSYLLVSAGHDGIYGTEDDICNFGN